MYVLWPVIYVPLLHRDEAAVFIARGTGRGIEGRAIYCICCEAVGHLIVDFQDAALGAVFSILLFVFAFDDGESFHDVFYSMAGSGEVRGEMARW